MRYETWEALASNTAWEPLFGVGKLIRRFNRAGPIVSAPKRKTTPIGWKTRGRKVDYFSDVDEGLVRLLELYDSLEAEGFKIHEIPYAELAGIFGGDYVGYRDGNTIYVAADDGKRTLSPNEKAYVAAHEAREKPDRFTEKPHEAVHREAEDLLAGLNYYSALDVAKRVGERLGWTN